MRYLNIKKRIHFTRSTQRAPEDSAQPDDHVGNDSPTLSFVTVEKEDCVVGVDHSGLLNEATQIVSNDQSQSEDKQCLPEDTLPTEENYFESFTQTDLVIKFLKEDEPGEVGISNVGDSQLGAENTPANTSSATDAAIVGLIKNLPLFPPFKMEKLPTRNPFVLSRPR